MSIIISIKPKWAQKIYSGEKTIEWRKTRPSMLIPREKIYIYETAPISQVTGYFVMAGIINFHGRNWTKPSEQMQKCIDAGCVPVQDLIAYQGTGDFLCAWGVEKVVKFERPKSLEEFNTRRPPQSWCYTEIE